MCCDLLPFLLQEKKSNFHIIFVQFFIKKLNKLKAPMKKHLLTLSNLQKNQSLFIKIAFVFLFAFLSISLQAQTEVSTAKTYLTQNAVKQRLSNADINDMSVSSAYLSPSTGWYHIYFNQNYKAVEVYNGMLNVTLQNGEVKYVANTFVPFLAEILPNASLNRSVTPVDALIKAAQFKNLTPSKSKEIQILSSISLVDGSISKASYQDNYLSDEPVNVKLYWLPYQGLENGKSTNKVALTWNVNFLTKNGKNKWNIHVDANTGEILEEHDDIIHCDFGVPNKDGISESHEGHAHTLQEARNNSLVAPNQYNVFDYPLEAPTFGSRTLVTSPYNRFAPTGTGPDLATNGWHSDGTTAYTNTKGNNVDAKDDIANNNETTIGSSPSSASLDFNYTYSQTTGSAATNLNAAITNLFYWNNVLHDVLWRYGFDEPSGNFQKNNMGRGGADNDFVFADAQDGSGTNNANFSTPADGGNGRMQMFIWSNAGSPLYQPDSDFDNGIIAHEYGHGWSTRLTGGPANSNCLRNAEQGGEGWSDYVALMTTTNWSSLTPSLASANIPRGIGTYVLGQAITGAGIRPFRYSYDKATYNNTVTYAGVGNTAVFSQPHGIGSIWATMLWDMTWEIIFQDNQIVSDIYTVPANITDMRGNIAALKLVNEGLRLQPCSPSFIQSRDAILQADVMLFGGRYHCAIAKAFARRGLGANASTGISTNDRTVTEDFTPISGPNLSSPIIATTCSNQVFNYTATTITSGTTFSWTRPVVAGISNGAGSGSNANVSETLINTTTEPITVKYLFTISPNDCPGSATSQAVNVTVNPNITPIVADYSVCQNASVPSGQGLEGAAATNSVNSIINPGNFYIRGGGNNTTTYVQAEFVFYKTITFVAPSSAAVTFTITAAAITGPDQFDTYLSLYQTSFNPNSPATNFLRGDDDSGPLQFSSQLTQTLTAGQTYILVVSTFGRFQSGTFTLQATSTLAADAIGFGIDQKWFTAASGGNAIFTGRVLNPVGLAGSGIPNTSTTGTTNFYVSNPTYPECRTATTFNISSPTAPTGTNNPTICSGATASLSATCAAGTVNWYSASSVAIPFVGSPFVTPSLSANTTYNVRCESGACLSPFVAVSVTIGSITAPTGTNNPTICSGATASLSATCATGTVNWYNASSVAIPFVGSPFVTPSLSANTTYNVRCESGACLSPFTQVTVTVGSPLTAPSGTNNPTICSGATASLSATCATGTVNWYSASSVAIPFVGSPFVTPSLSVNTTYNVRCESGACMSAFVPVTVTIGTPSAPTGTNNPTICSGATASLSATCAAGTVNWYSASSVAIPFVGSPFVTPSLSANTTYNVRCESGACLSPFVAVSVTIGNIAAPTGTTNPTICSGATASLSATCGTGTVNWYSASSVAIPFVGSPFVTPSLSANTMYNVRCESGACLSPFVSVTVTVNPKPIVSANADQTICAGATASLSATCNLLSLTATLSGASEVPANASTATGNAIGTFNTITNQLDVSVAFNGLSANASAGHIHNAAVGVNGPVIIPFIVPSATSGTFTHSSILTTTNAAALLAGNTYVNIHNSTFPGGEVRGQINAVCVANTYVWNPGALSGATVTVSPSTTTVYTVTASSASGCTATATTSVSVVPAPTASNTGPYLVGQTIALSASLGSAYSWAGPNGFSSTIANPTIISGQVINAGIYTVTVINGVCTATATTNVIVNVGIDPCVQILSYTYVQAGNPSQALFNLTNGMNIAQRPTATSIIVKPICNSVTIGSVDMAITGPSLNYTILQNVEPFALFDNSGPSINGQVLAPGTYALTVTGYMGDNRAGGTTYGPVVTTFTIVGTAPTISTPTFAGTAFCAGTTVNVSFTTTGVFAGGNIFNVLLSDANGSFVVPQIIGTTTVAGTVLCTIPVMAMGGENYRIKVVSTDPAAAGNYNLAALTVNPVTYNLVSPTNDYPVGTATKQAIQTINARNNITGASIIQYKAGNAINLTPGFRVVSHPGSSFKADIAGCSN